MQATNPQWAVEGDTLQTGGEKLGTVEGQGDVGGGGAGHQIPSHREIHPTRVPVEGHDA